MGTHMDALGHLGHQRLMGCGHCRTLLYNGNRLDEIWTPSGLTRLGIEQAPIFVTRGVLLDVEGLKGAPSRAGSRSRRTICAAASTARACPADGWLRPGDVVLIRTGHGARFETEADTWYDSAPGLGLPAAEYLSAFRPCVVGADNFAVDVMPPVDPDFVLPCHQHLIIRHGIHLHEG